MRDDRQAVRASLFAVSADGHYVGEDGFVVPKDFTELFEQDPLGVRHWVTRQMRGRVQDDAILDLEQELLLHLCSLPANSQFRRKGANVRVDGCTDVIQCFDPVRQFGATAKRFHNFINLCLTNRLRTILTRQRHSPLFNPRNLSLAAVEVFHGEKGDAESIGKVDDAYLLHHSATFARECRRVARAEDPVRKAYVREFEKFVGERNYKLLEVVRAIERAATLPDAEKTLGMPFRNFDDVVTRCRC